MVPMIMNDSVLGRFSPSFSPPGGPPGSSSLWLPHTSHCILAVVVIGGRGGGGGGGSTTLDIALGETLYHTLQACFVLPQSDCSVIAEEGIRLHKDFSRRLPPQYFLS